MNKGYCRECDEMHPASFYCTYAADAAKARIREKNVPPMVGHKITRVRVPLESIETRNRPESAGGSAVSEEAWVQMRVQDQFPLLPGAQGAPPPEPAKGMNGPTGAPQWGCDPGSGEIWITGDNTIAREVGESQSYVSRDGAALSRAPEIPVTEEMIQAVRRRAMCPGWTDNVVAEFYRLMRAKEPVDLTTARCWSAAVDHGKQMLAERNNVLDIATDQAYRINAIEAENTRLAFDAKQCHAWNDVLSKENQRLKTELAKRDASFNRLRYRK